MPAQENMTDPTIDRIAEGAAALRDCATSIRTRLQGREQTLVRLRTELSALRSISEITILKPPPPPPPPKAVPISPPQTPAHPASPSVESILADLLHPEPVVAEPIVAEPVVEQPFVETPLSEQTLIIEPPAVQKPKSSAPVMPIYSRPAMPPVASSPKAPRSLFVTLLPIACLVGITALLAFSRFHTVKPTGAAKTDAPPPAQAPAPPPLDEKSAEALALVRQWRMAGDDKTLFTRLGSVIQHPNGSQAWSVERLDENSYLVIYREAAGSPIYAFETRLKVKSVMPSPEATERLTLMRVRDEAAAALLHAR